MTSPEMIRLNHAVVKVDDFCVLISVFILILVLIQFLNRFDVSNCNKRSCGTFGLYFYLSALARKSLSLYSSRTWILTLSEYCVLSVYNCLDWSFKLVSATVLWLSSSSACSTAFKRFWTHFATTCFVSISEELSSLLTDCNKQRRNDLQQLQTTWHSLFGTNSRNLHWNCHSCWTLNYASNNKFI